MVEEDRKYLDNPRELSIANRRFHRQIHLASRNRYLVQQLEMVHRSMALLAETSLAADGRGEMALAEHLALVQAIENGNSEDADRLLKDHLSFAFQTRLKADAGSVKSANV
jgi:DNA-binding GntR family transcriptional regulator